MADDKSTHGAPPRQAEDDDRTMVHRSHLPLREEAPAVRIVPRPKESPADQAAAPPASAVETGLLGWLVIKNGDRRGRLYTLGAECTIGRQASDIVFEDDPQVSRIHAKLVVREGHFVIVDILSDNGTLVNGERIRSETMLKENDEIRVGGTVLVLKTLSPEGSA